MEKPGENSQLQPVVVTVLGERLPDELGIVDAHNHVWIEPVPGTFPELPHLTRQEAIVQELVDYRQAGGGAIVDCQPGGCGRNGLKLAELARLSGVQIVACTGFHLPKYYPPGYWLFQAGATQAADLFISEIQDGLLETRTVGEPVRAGFIKIACQASLTLTPPPLLEASVAASLQTGSAVEVHTEKGQAALDILSHFSSQGLDPRRLVLCHMDKHPDFGLHRELAQAGVTLEYDTFYRPKYDPENNLWPLLERMAAGGLAVQVALATDMAESEMWARLGGGPGLVSLPAQIGPRLRSLGIGEPEIAGMLGGNITRCLAHA